MTQAKLFTEKKLNDVLVKCFSKALIIEVIYFTCRKCV